MLKQIQVILKELPGSLSSLATRQIPCWWPSNEAAFYIIQHSTQIDNYLPTIKNAANKKELPFY